MGIRFRCHQCGHELHVKDFQGGKRSRCPACEIKFRIPKESADLSIPLEGEPEADSTASSAGSLSAGGRGQVTGQQTAGTLLNKSGSKKAASYSSDPANQQAVDVARDEPEAIQSVESDSVAPHETSLNQETQPSTHSLATPPKVEQPQAILEAPSATWYVRPPAGGQYGPAPANIFCEWLTENRVTRDSLVWRDGWPQWLVAGEVFSDYFGPAIPQTFADTTSSSTSQPISQSASSPSAASEQAVATEFVAPLSLSDRALAARKRQRKKNYMIMIAVLATIAVGLVIALVLVLMQNS